jgi:predicted nucleic acid-binding protein
MVVREAAFWDASALVPACVLQAGSARVQSNLRRYPPTVWWATYVEVRSAVARLRRNGLLDDRGAVNAVTSLERIKSLWRAIVPDDSVADEACRLLDIYPLRASDSLQLAAALTWCRQHPDGKRFICNDKRLSEAARAAGFSVVEL